MNESKLHSEVVQTQGYDTGGQTHGRTHTTQNQSLDVTNNKSTDLARWDVDFQKRDSQIIKDRDDLNSSSLEDIPKNLLDISEFSNNDSKV